MALSAATRTDRSRQKTKLIDADIHNELASSETLPKYLPARWQEHYRQFGGGTTHRGGYYPRSVTGNARTDAWPPSGLPPGADLDFMREQLLDRYGIEYGILNPFVSGVGNPNPEYAAAMARATNEWQVTEWATREERLRCSIAVPYEANELAAEEIKRWGDNPLFVQVLVMTRTAEPLGRPKYWAMYEAAEHYGLPVAIHIGGSSSGPATAAGWPSFYIEDHVAYAQAAQAQVTSLTFEGVFERFPKLRVVLTESGFAWLPPLMWRLDRVWEQLHQEVPFVRRPPSDYIRAQVRATTQPMEEPPIGRQFLQLLEHLGTDEMLMFASDYPHWDFDDPQNVFPTQLPEAARRKIMFENARSTYRL